MEDYNKIYKSLKEKYSDEEIADAMMIPQQLNKEEQQKANEEFARLRLKHRQQMSEKDKMLSGLLSIKYQVLEYIQKGYFDESKTLGKIIKKYLKVVKRTQKDLSNDINVHPSRLNRIINGKEKIGKAIAYRLEKHSGDIIPAIFWWKLMQKEIEQEINTEKEEREIEKNQVKNIAYRA